MNTPKRGGGVVISPDIKKTRIIIDENGNIISSLDKREATIIGTIDAGVEATKQKDTENK